MDNVIRIIDKAISKAESYPDRRQLEQLRESVKALTVENKRNLELCAKLGKPQAKRSK